MKTTKYQNGGSAGQSISSKGAYYPDAKCRAEGCPKNPNDPKYKKEVAKLTPQQKQKIGAKYQTGGPVEAMNKVMGKKPSLKKTLDYVKKNGSGYIPSNPATQRPNTDSYKSAGTSIKTAKRPNTKYQDGGRTISENAAERKSAKGKGLYAPTDGTKSKGLYVGYNKAGRKEVKETGGTEVYNLKPIRKVMKTGGATKKYQKGGRTISENAAARKVAKGKGTISKSYPSGPEEKGSYIGYSKEAKKSDSPFISMKNSKPARPIMKTGGATKKYQKGGPTAEQQIESGARKNYIANAKAKLMGVAAAARKSSGRKGKI